MTVEIHQQALAGIEIRPGAHREAMCSSSDWATSLPTYQSLTGKLTLA
jgi:hypothetical protein